jgi:type I restriction enzyme S subunit
MIELTPYSDFKPTGLPWLERIPEHWSLVPNRALVRRRKQLVGRNHHRYRLLSLTKQGIIVRDVASGKGKFSSDMGTSQEVRDGDLVFCFFDVPETPRTVGLSPHQGMITGAYTVLEPLQPGIGPYFELFYRAMDDSKLLSPLYSGLRNTIPVDRFLGTKSPVPPPDEQTGIVHFLHHANRRIDQFIRVKKKLIALLNEQKQAVIHRAVTRGLDPNVKMKDSGMPWLGQVPAHWSLTPNRVLMRIRKVLVGERHHEFQVLSLTKKGVVVRDMNAGGKYSSFWDRSQEVRPGDLVFCLFDVEETPRTVGLSAHGGMISGDYTVMEWIGDRRDAAEFVELFYIAMDDRKLLSPMYSGLRKRIPKPEFMSVLTPIPPPDEMHVIARTVKATSASTDLAINRLVREIALVSEYRTRLVADVVTGQLDVRAAAASLPDLEPTEPEDDEETEIGGNEAA